MDLDFLIFIINFVFSIMYVILIVRSLVSFIGREKQFGLICGLTDPLLKVIRLALPPQTLGMDVSPFILMVFLWLLQRLILVVII